jgi:glutaconate CoA-transferase, subunit B
MASDRDIVLVCAMARLLRGRRHVAVGANSPIPGSAALLAQALSDGAMRVEILGSRKYSTFSGLADLFDCASTGRLDAFFLGPGQIDGQANINMVGIGPYPKLQVRWPGSHGSPLLYMMIPNIILFRPDHRRRALVPKVDFITAPGVSAPNVYRPGGPSDLVTSMAHFSFDRERARFRLESVHPGNTTEAVIENTGFEFDHGPSVATTPGPDPEMLGFITDRIRHQIAELYPNFAASLAEGVEHHKLSA